MDELSIKVNILGRNYPLTIARSEENTVREAAMLVNDLSNSLQENYSVPDKQDLLAMAALKIAVKSLNRKSSDNEQQLISALEEVSHSLDF